MGSLHTRSPGALFTFVRHKVQYQSFFRSFGSKDFLHKMHGRLNGTSSMTLPQLMGLFFLVLFGLFVVVGTFLRKECFDLGVRLVIVWVDTGSTSLGLKLLDRGLVTLIR